MTVALPLATPLATAAQPPSAAEHERAMSEYGRRAEARALALGNRGPIRVGADGHLLPEILESYWTHGFYVFQGVVGPEELQELRADIDAVLSRAPVAPDATVDRDGRAASTEGIIKPPYRWAKPLSDPVGGTDKNNGRHPAAMLQPKPGEDAPAWTVELLDGNLHLSDACLRLYGHPGLLTVAASILGDDFVPYNEVTFVKEPGLGPSVAWHQDGTTHWDSPDWDHGAHGFNFMTQLYPSTAANGVWVLPGSHKRGKSDIRKMVAESGSDRIEGAVPMLCDAGDTIAFLEPEKIKTNPPGCRPGGLGTGVHRGRPGTEGGGRLVPRAGHRRHPGHRAARRAHAHPPRGRRAPPDDGLGDPRALRRDPRR